MVYLLAKTLNMSIVQSYPFIKRIRNVPVVEPRTEHTYVSGSFMERTSTSSFPTSCSLNCSTSIVSLLWPMTTVFNPGIAKTASMKPPAAGWQISHFSEGSAKVHAIDWLKFVTCRCRTNSRCSGVWSLTSVDLQKSLRVIMMMFRS
jgi:hypothetical protein